MRQLEPLREQRQEALLKLVAMAARTQLWLKELQRKRVIVARRQYLNDNARVIQYNWRAMKSNRALAKAEKGRKAIKRFMKAVLMAQRLAKAKPLHDAADTLQRFLTDFNDKANLLRKIVGDFVQRVIKAQRVWRDYMACRQGRLLALSRKWDSIDTPPADAPTFMPDPRRFARRKANRRSAHMPVGLDAPSDESGDSVFLTQRQNWAEPRCVGVNRGLQRGRYD